ncbi:protein D3 [Tribolium castaneum]|uniref:Odorant-binding protein A5-like Protein n=1 Tax=Tribolium castaneum TaxID=7070 RepID=D6WLP6_TRICA|nr:PREDICTED: protein D3 isoform X1 [Tribolium castaneum]EFA03425.2 Putative odorant-binding protein A5-like Protein [Tribolium castaneum]|eukprot:XP_972426.2 PREDICTED: protein D3 isoform X1 [Tribolium castaneum]
MVPKYPLLTTIFAFVALVSSHDHHAQIKKHMESDGIVPQILADAPPAHLFVTYPNGKKVHLGEELTPSEVKDEPQVKWDAASTKYYTLVMFDPDAPSRSDPSFADVKHWLVGNIQGGDVSTGDVIAEYFGSGPPKDTGLHRYIFLVYEQKERLTFDEPRSLKLSRAHRLKWSLKEFVKKYNLGAAVAGDYFKAKWEPYVDERNKNVTNN